MSEEYGASITNCFDYQLLDSGEFVITNGGSLDTYELIEWMNSEMADAWRNVQENPAISNSEVRIGTGFLKLTNFKMDLMKGTPCWSDIKDIMDARSIKSARIYVTSWKYGNWGYKDS